MKYSAPYAEIRILSFTTPGKNSSVSWMVPRLADRQQGIWLEIRPKPRCAHSATAKIGTDPDHHCSPAPFPADRKRFLRTMA